MTFALLRVRDQVCNADSLFSAPARLVALCLADYMGSNPEAWPSVRTIARWTGLGETTVKASLRALCEGPHAIFERHPGPRSGLDSTRYRLAPRGRVATGSIGDGVGSRPKGGRQATVGGSPADHERPNERLIERPNVNTPSSADGVGTVAAKFRSGRW